jgi:hypothetical protein
MHFRCWWRVLSLIHSALEHRAKKRPITGLFVTSRTNPNDFIECFARPVPCAA